MSRSMRTVGRESLVCQTVITAIVLSSVAAAQRAGSGPAGPSTDTNKKVDLSPRNMLVFPYGVQSFEGRENIKVGQDIQTLPGWQIQDGSGMLSAVVAENPNGFSRPGTKSRRWLAVEDLGATGAQSITSPPINAPEPWNYSWKFSIQVENAPVSGSDLPVLAIQHAGQGGSFSDAWGVRLTPIGAELYVTDTFGEPAVAPLFDFQGTTDVGQWIDIRVVTSLSRDTLRAFVNGTEVAMLRLRAPASTNLARQRFSYHGDGAGNLASLLLDDVGVAFLGSVCEEALTVDFTTEDDEATPLVNGQDVSSPDEFGAKMTIDGSGPNRGAAIFDSSVGGPNDPSQDTDLLVDQGNILILQTDAAGNPDAVGGIFPRPNDDEDGGMFTFAFNRWLQPLSIDIIDIDDTANEFAQIVLTDFSGATRTYTAPQNWTGNGGVQTLDLQTLAPQPGFGSNATAVEDAGFDPNAVVGMTVELGGSGALDNLSVIIPCVQLTFETEDDFNPVFSGTPLVNGQDLSSPPEFGVEAFIADSGPNSGAAIFDSTPGGPNDPGPDNDLLVGLGNILCLQNDLFATQTVAGIFDTPNDDTNGGDIYFTFPGEVECHRVDLIDVDEEEVNPAVVVLLDANGNTRTYTCPPGWTEDLLNDGPPAFRTLNLETLAPQGGFLFSATAVEDAGFDPKRVVMMTVTFGGAQDMDNFCFCP